MASAAGAWAPLPELDTAAAPAQGFGPQRTLYPARQLSLPPGPVEGRTYLPDGEVSSITALELAEPLSISAYAVAVINGVEHVLVADGDLAGTWIPSERVAARVGGQD